MSSRKGILMLILLLAFAALSEANVSNCYLKLPSGDSESQRANRELIESYGGRIIHEFPETGEFICWMAPSQYDLLHTTKPVDLQTIASYAALNAVMQIREGGSYD